MGVCPARPAFGPPGETVRFPEPCGKCGPDTAVVGFVGKEYGDKTGMKVGDEILVPGKDVPEPERCDNCNAITGRGNTRMGEHGTGCQKCHAPMDRGSWLDDAQTVRDYIECPRAIRTMRRDRVTLASLDALVTQLGKLEDRLSEVLEQRDALIDRLELWQPRTLKAEAELETLRGKIVDRVAIWADKSEAQAALKGLVSDEWRRGEKVVDNPVKWARETVETQKKAGAKYVMLPIEVAEALIGSVRKAGGHVFIRCEACHRLAEHHGECPLITEPVVDVWVVQDEHGQYMNHLWEWGPLSSETSVFRDAGGAILGVSPGFSGKANAVRMKLSFAS